LSHLSSLSLSCSQLYYNDQYRWAYTFQNCAVLSRYQAIESTIQEYRSSPSHRPHHPSGRQVYITERCLQSDYQIFAKKLHCEGKIDGIELKLYDKWFQQLMKTATVSLSGVILVDTAPNICADRIKGRGRDGEEGIPLRYLEDLNHYQEMWISSLADSNCALTTEPIPCKRTASLEDIEKFVSELLETSS
jgi:deoxyadenosine/deoxycytidine kinase